MSVNVQGNRSLSMTATNTIGATATARLYAGWFYFFDPTATTQFLFGTNTVNGGVLVGAPSAATEVTVQSQRATTTGIRVTSGANLGAGKWYFIAAYAASVSSAAADYAYVWVGTENTLPAGFATTQTQAPAGAVTGGTTFVMGNNQTSGALSMNGYVAWAAVIHSPGSNSILSLLKAASYTAPTVAELEYMTNTLVIPMWLGADLSNAIRPGNSTVLGEVLTANVSSEIYPLYGLRYIATTTGATSVVTITPNGGPSATIESPGRPLPVVTAAVAPLIHPGRL